MLAQDPLNLQCVQLKAAQEWAHKGEQLSFIFPKVGAGKWVAGAVVQKLGPGDVLVLNATLGGKLCAAGPGELVFWCISLQLEHLFPLFGSSEICLLQNISDGFKTARLYPATIPVAQECHRRLAKMPAQVNLDHRCHLLQVVAGILTVEFNRAKSQRTGFVRPEEHMAQVFDQLTAGELLGLSVGELADKFGCSRRHLNRLFHHYFGISVAALRMEMRLLKSVTLLRDPGGGRLRIQPVGAFQYLLQAAIRRQSGSMAEAEPEVRQPASPSGTGCGCVSPAGRRLVPALWQHPSRTRIGTIGSPSDEKARTGKASRQRETSE